jgi:uncharacterized membrane protein YkvA (DUF1232 family)
MNNQESDFYKKLRDKIRVWARSEDGKANRWTEYLLYAPDLFHLLCKLTIDKRVSSKSKAKLAAAIAYFVSPLDLVPEAIVGPIGFVDDIALAAYVLNAIINETDSSIIEEHWAGDDNVLHVIKKILGVTNEMVGRRVWKKVKAVLVK